MNCLIIEDEQIASQRLKKLICTYFDNIEVDAVLTSVEESIKYLRENEHPNFIFMDIQLQDGLSFHILENIKIDVPIIFVTGHDRYALRAHRAKAFDYLLKPINKDQLINAVKKLSESNFDDLLKLKSANDSTFVVQFGSRYYITESEDIAYIENIENIRIMTRKDGIRFPIKLTIIELRLVLPSYQFFQVSDNLIISIDAIKYLEYHKDIPVITLDPKKEQPIRVTREYISGFKQWLQVQYS